MSLEFPQQFNMADYFLYHNVEKGRKNKICLYYEDETFTYGDAVKMSNRAGNALREMGVGIEDRVLICLPDCPGFVWAWFATSKIGGVITMVNPLLTVDDYKYYLDYTRAKVVVIHEAQAEVFAEAVQGARYLKSVLVVSEQSAIGNWQSAIKESSIPFISFNELLEQMSDELTPADTSKDDIAIWLFTSGSTGKAKGAVHFHHDLPYNTEVFAKRTIGVSENDLTVSVPKLFFGYATGTNLLFPFAVGGATALFSERSTAEQMFSMIEKYRPTILTTVPTMINGMLNSESATEKDLSCLRFCYSAGEALPAELYTRWKNTFGVEILDGIGSAEMFHIYITNRLGDVKPGSLGRVVEGYEARIIDADGNEVPTGEMGTLKIKGDSASLCYWGAHEKSKETFAGDWCTTGDQFHKDEEGYFWYHGRTDDMLKVGGIFVAPAEIENCLLQHESVLECAVVGYTDNDRLIKSKAFIVLRESFTGDETLIKTLQDFVKSNLAPYKYPRFVEFIDAMPKNDRGKIDRIQLKNR